MVFPVFLNMKDTPKVGNKVFGKYCGIPYKGTVLSVVTNQANRSQLEYTVALDEPINVFGQIREKVLIDSKGRAWDEGRTTLEIGEQQ